VSPPDQARLDEGGVRVSSGLAQLLRDAARLVIDLDFFPAQLIAGSGQATLVGVVDEGRLGPVPLIGPDLSLILVPRYESPIIPPPSNEITMQGEFVSSVRWVGGIAERAGGRGTGMSVRLSYVPAGEKVPSSGVPRERQTGSALVPRVQVSGRPWHRAEFAVFMRAARSLARMQQLPRPRGNGTSVTGSGYTTFVFSRTGRVRDPGREVVMRPTPSEVVLRRSASGVTVEPSRRQE
jgi:hypothetical protein